jgi:hypothetical protein
MDELLTLERGFWTASRDPDYYKKHMADEGLAVFSMGVMDKSAAVASTSGSDGAAWTDIELKDARLLEITEGAVALVYRGSAERDGKPYQANCATVYARRDRSWKMILHQQSAEDGSA